MTNQIATSVHLANSTVKCTVAIISKDYPPLFDQADLLILKPGLLNALLGSSQTAVALDPGLQTFPMATTAVNGDWHYFGQCPYTT